ncbi:cyanamide hydratase [Herbiconiux sp. VKM Ac-1786]|uniref:cyanamide hydratase n=1 Tax=Herbiconiux sp. VKM Ac-1786 TaxID=2783824 RepID=UPI00188B35C5|nr:cyanamide hydratase [Herbiconiux sp. VKM Ac-1786]MBF4574228.1 cyanamide hydratase [Herbiconiux sp. VKM Ac-1786]
MHLDDLPLPDTPAARAALEVARRFHSPAFVNHGLRSYLWAAAAARTEGLAVDDELLFVAAVLHDLGLEPAFDSHTLPFEEAGGLVAWVFASGAGWTEKRRDRAAAIIVAHMADAVDPAVDAEGYLLEIATGLDISGRNPEGWDAELRAEVLAAHPRLDLAGEFTGCILEQAARKPGSTAATAVASGLPARLAANPLGRD